MKIKYLCNFIHYSNIKTAEALTFESEEAFASAFEVLGIVSMEKLIEHPTVISASENVINYIDLNKLSKIFE